MPKPFRLVPALRKRISDLEAALAPFARESEQWSTTVNNRYRPGVTEPRSKQALAKAEFNIGHLRRASKLLEKK